MTGMGFAPAIRSILNFKKKKAIQLAQFKLKSHPHLQAGPFDDFICTCMHSFGMNEMNAIVSLFLH